MYVVLSGRGVFHIFVDGIYEFLLGYREIICGVFARERVKGWARLFGLKFESYLRIVGRS